MRASTVTTLATLLAAAFAPGVVRSQTAECRFRSGTYPHLAAIPSGARALVDDNNNTTTWVHDARDRVTYTIGADGAAQRTIYDADSLVKQTIDQNGTVLERTHDAVGRMVKLEAVRRAFNLEGTGQNLEGSVLQAFEWDGLSRLRLSVDQNDPADPSDDVATSFVHDSLSRQLEERHRFRAQTTVNTVFTQNGRITVGAALIDKTVGRTFDLDSNRTSTIYSKGEGPAKSGPSPTGSTASIASSRSSKARSAWARGSRPPSGSAAGRTCRTRGTGSAHSMGTIRSGG